MKIDLHTHTTFSDGQLAPEKLVQLAVKKKLTHLSVTDHDTVEALEQIEALCNDAEIEWIPGIEISSHCGGEEVHLLAYHIDRSDPEFLEFLSEQKKDRISRIDAMIRKLQDHGVLIEKKDLEPYLKDSGLPGRPHLAQALVKKGYVPNLREARIYLSPNQPGYVPRQVPEASLVSKNSKNGGVAVLAHPGLLRDRSIPETLRKEGLAGIEAYHPSHKKSEMKAFALWGEQNGMVVTGGSDFHGFKGEKNAALGSLPVPEEAVEKLQRAAVTARE
jgi:predicted metal-dependent phosphoesterase TrpH